MTAKVVQDDVIEIAVGMKFRFGDRVYFVDRGEVEPDEVIEIYQGPKLLKEPGNLVVTCRCCHIDGETAE